MHAFALELQQPSRDIHQGAKQLRDGNQKQSLIALPQKPRRAPPRPVIGRRSPRARRGAPRRDPQGRNRTDRRSPESLGVEQSHIHCFRWVGRQEGPVRAAVEGEVEVTGGIVERFWKMLIIYVGLERRGLGGPDGGRHGHRDSWQARGGLGLWLYGGIRPQIQRLFARSNDCCMMMIWRCGPVLVVGEKWDL